MTLDEAITHEKELAEKNYLQGMLCHANPNDEKLDKYIECGRYHEQLVKWLENYKRLSSETEQDIYERAYKNGYDKGSSDGHFFGYNKAIDDFVSELKSILPIAVHKDCSEIDYEIDYVLHNMRFKIDNIAEKLKTGDTYDK